MVDFEAEVDEMVGEELDSKFGNANSRQVKKQSLKKP